MSKPQVYAGTLPLAAKLREVAVLFKLRLASLVVLSAGLGYLMGVPKGAFDVASLLLLLVAGTLLTGASNAFNQVLEVREDALMERTKDRPLVRACLPGQGGLTQSEAVIAAFIAGGGGTFMLWSFFGPLTGILGFISLFMYVALYTPLKKRSPWAVFVGAFPGAFPPMLGYVAATGQFGLGPGLLFAMQFIWQFPHFWAIAWVLDQDYARAGFRLLPSPAGTDGRSAFLILVYTVLLIPVGMLPWVFGFTGPWAMAAAIVLGLVMLRPAIKLFRSHDRADARKLMFASFIYLPLLQLAYVLDRAF